MSLKISLLMACSFPLSPQAFHCGSAPPHFDSSADLLSDWPASEQEVPPGREAESTQHLWEESWDDDDTSEEFSKQLKAELDKVKGGKK